MSSIASRSPAARERHRILCGKIRKRDKLRRPLLGVWRHMRSRCENPRNNRYNRYGGRGIAVCKRWRASYDAFARDMGPRPPGTSIDRIDNDGGYWCGKCGECRANNRKPNCRWATREEQDRNTSRVVVVHHNGRSACVKDWARELGVDYMSLARRLRKGQSLDSAAAALTAGKRRRPLLVFNGQPMLLPDIAKATGLERSALYRRIIACGEPVEAAVAALSEFRARHQASAEASR